METKDLIDAIHNALFQWYDVSDGEDVYLMKETIFNFR